MTLFIPIIIAMLNVIISHTMLTRKKSAFYSLQIFILNSALALMLFIYLRNIIIDDSVFKYVYYLIAFTYIPYIVLVFSDSISIKLFSMFNACFFSIIVISIFNIFYELTSHYSVDIYGVIGIRVVMHILVLGASYQWYGKYFKEVIVKINDSVTYLISGYTLIASLILVGEFSLKNGTFKNIHPVTETSLLIFIIILGYLSINFALSYSSKVSILEQSVVKLKEQSDNYHKLESHDALTGVANRPSIIDQISEAITDSKSEDKKFIILLFDIDKFKSINDRYGYIIGDIALKTVTNRVEDCLREDDEIGRLGGNEFIVLSKGGQTKEDSEFIIKRIIKALKTPIIVGGKPISIEISMGVSMFPTDAQTIGDLLYRADKAMNEAKKTSGTHYKFFNELE